MQETPRRLIYIRLEKIGPLVRIIRHVTPREYRPTESSLNRIVSLCVRNPDIQLQALDYIGYEFIAEVHTPVCCTT